MVDLKEIQEPIEIDYCLLTDSANDMIAILNQEFQYNYINRKFSEVLGYSRKYLLGKRPQDFLHPEDLIYAQSVLKKLSHTGECSCQARMKRKDGIYVWLNVNGKIVIDDSNKRTIILILRDISENKMTEKLYQELYENVPNAYFSVGRDKSIMRCNTAAVNLLGYTLEEFSKMKVFDLYNDSEDGLGRAKDLFQRFLNGENIQDEELQMKHKNGNPVWISLTVNPIKDEFGQIVESRSMVINITERKKMVEKLKESEKRYRDLFEAAPISYTLIDFKGVIIDCNSATEKIIGYKKNELIGREFLALPVYKNEDMNLLRDRFEEMIKNPNKPPLETRVMKENGHFVWTQSYASIIRIDNQNLIQILTSDITERKEAENKIKEQNKFLTSVIESLSHPFYVINTNNYKIVLGNAAFNNSNLSSNTTCYAFTHKRNNPCTGDHICPLEIVKRTKKPVSVEHLHYDKNGDVRNIEVHGYPIFDQDGNVVQMIEYSIDITERTRVEQNLKDSEEKFRSVVENIPDIVMSLDRDGTILFINQVIPGLTVEQVVGTNVREYIFPEYREIAEEAIEKVFQTGEPITYEVSGVGPDGSISWYSTKIGPILSDEKIVAAIQITTDITGRRQMEQKLKESEEKFRTMSSAAKDAIIFIDNQGKIYFWNAAAEKIFGYTANEILGTDFHPLFAPEKYREAYRNGFEKFKKTGKGIAIENTFELDAKRKDGTIFPVEISISAVRMKDEWHAMGIIRDITERKEAEKVRVEFTEKLEEEVSARTQALSEAYAQQRQYLEEIVKSSQFKSDFMSSMSHELRTPLNAIIGFSQLLLEGFYGQLNEEQLDFVTDIKTSSDHLLEMIQHILDIYKLESGQLILNIKKFSLNTILEQVITTIEPLYSKKGLEFNVFKADKDIIIRADAIRLKEILVNLLTNAIKFTQKGKITLKILENDTNWEFQVIDTGIGIAKKDFNLIFKDFKRVNSPFVQSTPGSGLGLSVAKRLAELHGGGMYFTSELEKGSTFTFSIPKKI